MKNGLAGLTGRFDCENGLRHGSLIVQPSLGILMNSLPDWSSPLLSLISSCRDFKSSAMEENSSSSLGPTRPISKVLLEKVPRLRPAICISLKNMSLTGDTLLARAGEPGARHSFRLPRERDFGEDSSNWLTPAQVGPLCSGSKPLASMGNEMSMSSLSDDKVGGGCDGGSGSLNLDWASTVCGGVTSTTSIDTGLTISRVIFLRPSLGCR
mmetsp:Transcript_8461/g.15154  ORF Transcript_8461/g.15154 Transcript_8461/m.15154 type:complete len:211 (+) Transcript_8461:918-1550(+)